MAKLFMPNGTPGWGVGVVVVVVGGAHARIHLQLSDLLYYLSLANASLISG